MIKKTIPIFVLYQIRISIMLSMSVMLLNCDQNNNIMYQAIVTAEHTGTPGVVIDGIPTYQTVTEALAAAPAVNKSPFVIYLRNGSYHEKLSVDKSNIHLIGESRDGTIITYDATGETISPEGEPYGTWGCFTLRIRAAGFRAENLTIENSFDYPGNAMKSDDDSSKIKNTQAVALMTAENCDRAEFINCKISGYQDTLFTNSGRSYFYQCQIFGHVDFIFGAGQSVFDKCEIVSRNRQNKNPSGYITAPSTPVAYPFGFLFVDCRLIKENALLPMGSVRLGRPWHPGADLSISGSTVFINCFMEDHIGSKGYARISSRDSDGNRIWFDLKPDSRFFEYGSHGPGAINSRERPILDASLVRWYNVRNVLNGWVPREYDESISLNN